MYLEFNDDASGLCMVMQHRMMPAASDNGSQPYSYPPGGCEMAGTRCNKNNSLPLGRRHELLESLKWAALVPYLKARLKWGASLSPAISRCLKARLYGWLPLSNAYGIFSLQPHNQSINISYYNSFSIYRHSPLHLISNLYAFPIATNPQTIPFPPISSL